MSSQDSMRTILPFSGQTNTNVLMDTQDPSTYLSNKRVLLSNPGTKLNDLYYSFANVQVDMAECTFNFGRYTQSLTSTSLGGTSLLTIPNSSFLSDCWLHLELPPVVANQTLCRGWGYGLIQSINYLFGSSNVSNISINGQSLMQIVLAESETAEKRDELMDLGGSATIATTTGNISAMCLIPLPWSNGSSVGKLPFDTTLLSNPVTITISFLSASAVYGGTGALPTQFSSAILFTRQGELLNKELSLRNAMYRDPQLTYEYPFIHRQSYQVAIQNAIATPTTPYTGYPASFNSVNLLSIINADLVGISFWVIRDDSVIPAAGGHPNPFAAEAIQNVRLSFNGLVYYLTYKQDLRAANMLSLVGSSKFNTVTLTPVGAGPYTAVIQPRYSTYIDFSRIRQSLFSNRFSNVFRLGNNTLTLDFTVPAVGAHTVYVTYHYNGINSVYNGESHVYFD